jgi:phosphonate transport system substrate-binding protein
VVHYSLLKEGGALAFFGEWVRTGAHARSLEAVANGDADATAIDSHVLAMLLRNDAALARHVRVIDSFGPSTMPPLVVRSDVDPHLKQELRRALLSMHERPTMCEHLRAGHIERFAAVDDARYDDIRRMYQIVMAQHGADA